MFVAFFLKEDYHGSDQNLLGLSLSLIAVGSLAQSPSEIGYALILELAPFSLRYHSNLVRERDLYWQLQA